MKFDGHAWFADVALDFTTATIEYKYAVKHPHDDSITFEDGVNRKLRTSALNEDFLIIHDGHDVS